MQRRAFETRGSRSARTVWQAAVAAAVLMSGVCRAEAARTTPGCLAKKLNEWGSLRKCQATEEAKRLQGKPADPTSCQTRFAAKLGALSARAKEAALPCRYTVNGDGTLTDYDTGLQWEQKTTDGSVHDRENAYDWSPTLGRPNGTVFTDFLATLNAGTSSDGTTSSGCFAGHCDWRLPSIVELLAIVDAGAPGCDTRGGACIDETVFGPTIGFFHWSATTETDAPIFAWGIAFGDGSVTTASEDAVLFARAVRSAL